MLNTAALKRNIYKAVYFMIISAVIISMCGCSKSGKNSGVLTVGTNPDLPPFCCYDQYGNPDGFDIALIKEAAVQMGYKSVEFKTMDFDRLIISLNSGQVDCVISAMAVNDARKNRLIFPGYTTPRAR